MRIGLKEKSCSRKEPFALPAGQASAVKPDTVQRGLLPELRMPVLAHGLTNSCQPPRKEDNLGPNTCWCPLCPTAAEEARLLFLRGFGYTGFPVVFEPVDT